MFLHRQERYISEIKIESGGNFFKRSFINLFVSMFRLYVCLCATWVLDAYKRPEEDVWSPGLGL